MILCCRLRIWAEPNQWECSIWWSGSAFSGSGPCYRSCSQPGGPRQWDSSRSEAEKAAGASSQQRSQSVCNLEHTTCGTHTTSSRYSYRLGCERSLLIIDRTDQRLQSPFQGWLVDEILLSSRIPSWSDARQRAIISMSSCSRRWALGNFNLVFAGSMTSYGSVPCGKWDTATARVLSHNAFQPCFRWPVMEWRWLAHALWDHAGGTVQTPTWQYRSHISDTLISVLQATSFIPTFVVTIFQGWRVDPLLHEGYSISSAVAFGLDAENRMSLLECSRSASRSSCSVPPSCLSSVWAYAHPKCSLQNPGGTIAAPLNQYYVFINGKMPTWDWSCSILVVLLQRHHYNNMKNKQTIWWHYKVENQGFF